MLLSCKSYNGVECSKFSNEPKTADFTYIISQVKIIPSFEHHLKPNKISEVHKINRYKKSSFIKLDGKSIQKINLHNVSGSLHKSEYTYNFNSNYDRTYYTKAKNKTILKHDISKSNKEIEIAKKLTVASIPVSLIGGGLGIFLFSYLIIAILTLLSCIFCIYSIYVFIKNWSQMNYPILWISTAFVSLLLSIIIGYFGFSIVYYISNFHLFSGFPNLTFM